MSISMAVYLKTRECRGAGADKDVGELEPCILLTEMSNGVATIKNKNSERDCSGAQ